MMQVKQYYGRRLRGVGLMIRRKSHVRVAHTAIMKNGRQSLLIEWYLVQCELKKGLVKMTHTRSLLGHEESQ